MKIRSRRAAIIFFGIAVYLSGCASPSTTGKLADSQADSADKSRIASNVEIEGRAYALDGASVTARAIIAVGESRRPVAIDANRIAFASRRFGLERWQVFEADLSKKTERRVSFDAGDTEPIVAVGRRLVIASSSDERKSGERVLNKYRSIFSSKRSTADQAPQSALQHLLLEHPASARKGTEWVRMSREAAPTWSVSVDKDRKQALALKLSTNSNDAFRISLGVRDREPDARSWTKLNVDKPNTTTGGTIVDGEIFPDGSQILWSNGSILWTTGPTGQGAKRLGDDSIPSASDLAIDPTGHWIIFSTPTPTRGQNLMALHKSGRCLKTLTELPGDEIEPAFSHDGSKLMFAFREGDGSRIGEIPFGSPATIAAACP